MLSPDTTRSTLVGQESEIAHGPEAVLYARAPGRLNHLGVPSLRLGKAVLRRQVDNQQFARHVGIAQCE